jgi:dTDP-4-dehydrorhamnose reductase
MSETISTKKILLLGGSSYLGRFIYSKLGKELSTTTYNKTPVKDGVFFDAREMRISEISVDLKDYSHAIILLGLTSPDYCAKNKDESYFINVTRLKLVIDDLLASGIIPIFTSTEAVFDGLKGNYTEVDKVNPILEYARQKVEIEIYLEQKSSSFAIVRLAKIFGLELDDKTLLSAWLSQIYANENIRCASDQIFSPIEVQDVADCIIYIIQKRLNGIFHIANKEFFPRSSLLRILLSYYEKYRPYNGKITECSINDFNSVEPRPLDISLSPSKFILDGDVKIKSLDFCCETLVRKFFLFNES